MPISAIAIEARAAASLAATNKTNKYCQLCSTHIFTPVAIERARTGTIMLLSRSKNWDGGRLPSPKTPETTILFQQLSVTSRKENTVSFQNMFNAS